MAASSVGCQLHADRSLRKKQLELQTHSMDEEFTLYQNASKAMFPDEIPSLRTVKDLYSGYEAQFAMLETNFRNPHPNNGFRFGGRRLKAPARVNVPQPVDGTRPRNGSRSSGSNVKLGKSQSGPTKKIVSSANERDGVRSASTTRSKILGALTQKQKRGKSASPVVVVLGQGNNNPRPSPGSSSSANTAAHPPPRATTSFTRVRQGASSPCAALANDITGSRPTQPESVRLQVSSKSILQKMQRYKDLPVLSPLEDWYTEAAGGEAETDDDEVCDADTETSITNATGSTSHDDLTATVSADDNNTLVIASPTKAAATAAGATLKTSERMPSTESIAATGDANKSQETVDNTPTDGTSIQKDTSQSKKTDMTDGTQIAKTNTDVDSTRFSQATTTSGTNTHVETSVGVPASTTTDNATTIESTTNTSITSTSSRDEDKMLDALFHPPSPQTDPKTESPKDEATRVLPPRAKRARKSSGSPRDEFSSMPAPVEGSTKTAGSTARTRDCLPATPSIAPEASRGCNTTVDVPASRPDEFGTTTAHDQAPENITEASTNNRIENSTGGVSAAATALDATTTANATPKRSTNQQSSSPSSAGVAERDRQKASSSSRRQSASRSSDRDIRSSRHHSPSDRDRLRTKRARSRSAEHSYDGHERRTRTRRSSIEERHDASRRGGENSKDDIKSSSERRRDAGRRGTEDSKDDIKRSSERRHDTSVRTKPGNYHWSDRRSPARDTRSADRHDSPRHSAASPLRPRGTPTRSTVEFPRSTRHNVVQSAPPVASAPDTVASGSSHDSQKTLPSSATPTQHTPTHAVSTHGARRQARIRESSSYREVSTLLELSVGDLKDKSDEYKKRCDLEASAEDRGWVSLFKSCLCTFIRVHRIKESHRKLDESDCSKWCHVFMLIRRSADSQLSKYLQPLWYYVLSVLKAKLFSTRMKELYRGKHERDKLFTVNLVKIPQSNIDLAALLSESDRKRQETMVGAAKSTMNEQHRQLKITHLAVESEALWHQGEELLGKVLHSKNDVTTVPKAECAALTQQIERHMDLDDLCAVLVDLLKLAGKVKDNQSVFDDTRHATS
eukprot:m.650060 g.650060  ORF g.650060 m.650060 type:complete len:1080 (+) comp22668_c0_seq2:192-3431(+)